MNAFKRYCATHLGIKPESAYPWLSFEVSPGILLDSIIINAEQATVTTIYNVMVIKSQVTRQGQLEPIPENDGNPHF